MKWMSGYSGEALDDHLLCGLERGKSKRMRLKISNKTETQPNNMLGRGKKKTGLF